MSDGQEKLIRDLVVLLAIFVIVLIIIHKYGAYILTGLGIAGAAKLAKNLLPSGIIAAPIKGSAAEKAIVQEAVADGEITASQAATAGISETGEIAAATGAEIAGEAVATDVIATGAAEVAAETIAEEILLGAVLL